MMMLSHRRALLVFTLAALPFVAGSSCAVFWSSDSGSSDDDERDKDDKRIIVVASGAFGDPPVSGLRYESGALSGTTGENGEFEYEPGNSVQFFLGDIRLGAPVAATADMSAEDLVAGEERGESAAINIRRLLTSLDAEPGGDTIAIPREVQAAAVRTNDDVAPTVDYLDFSDDAIFANTASQLVAVLTSGYPFTAMLVEAGDVTRQPARAIAPQAPPIGSPPR